MARFKRMPGCSVRDCCGGGGGGPCVKFIPYGAPFTEFFDTANRFSNWNLIGLDSTNTYVDSNPIPNPPFEYGHVLVTASKLPPFGPFVESRNIIEVWKSTDTFNPANRLCRWEAPGMIAPGTIILSEINSSGVSGSVDYDVPLVTDGDFTSLRLRSTQLGCLMTLDATEIGTITWELIDISDPFTYAPGITFGGTSMMIGTYAVPMSTEQDRCTAATRILSTGYPLTATGYPGPNQDDANYEIRFNWQDGFNVLWEVRNTGVSSFDGLTQIEPLFDICSEIPETTLTNAAGSYVKFRMFHTPA